MDYRSGFTVVIGLLATPLLGGEGPGSFCRQELTATYYSEGAAIGDLNRDGVPDVVYGPLWFAGPTFQEPREIYPAVAQPREGYADHFFAWVRDFNQDGYGDVLTVGFPGTPVYVYENPGPDGWGTPWPKHQVLDSLGNESPQFEDVNGDGQSELVGMQAGCFGYASYDAASPFAPWKFHAVSTSLADHPFTHGLGVGDVNGDGRTDILHKDGWYAQPADPDAAWPFHAVRFAEPGGADIQVFDVDGDGDQDVISSQDAHAYGLVWHEQVDQGSGTSFRPHKILGATAGENPHGVVFSELHALAAVDLDQDGQRDLVTGKTYWSHHTQSPDWDGPAVVYGFCLRKTDQGPDWVPFQVDDTAGIGRQIAVGDVNHDGRTDLVVGGMKGCHLLLQEGEPVEGNK